MPGSRGGRLSDRPGGTKPSVDVHTSMLLPELPLAAWGDRSYAAMLRAGSLLILDAKMPENAVCVLRQCSPPTSGSARIHFFCVKRAHFFCILCRSEARPNSAFPDFLSSLTHGGPSGPQFRAELPYSDLTYSALTAGAADLQLDATSTEYKPIIDREKEVV